MIVFDKFLNYFYYIVVTITMIYSIFLWLKKGYISKQKYFFIYMITVFVLDVLGNLYIKNSFKINSNYLFFPQILMMFLYFRYFFIKDYEHKNDRKFLNSVTALSLLLTFYFQFSVGFSTFNNKIFLVIILFYLLISLQWFLHSIGSENEQDITVKQSFWVSTGILLWCVFALFRLYLGTYIYHYNQDVFIIINFLFSIFTIIMYIFFIKGLKCVDYNILRTFNYLKK